SVVRSGAPPPAPSPTAWGATQKNATPLPVFFFVREIFNPTKNKNNHNPPSKADKRKTNNVENINKNTPRKALHIYLPRGYTTAKKHLIINKLPCRPN
ncbi:hypothetical protein ACVGXX_00210, partial [Enterobacter intestinihominis]